MAAEPPELDKALAESEKLLADPRLADPERRQALLQQAQILLGLGRAERCAATLDKIPDNPLLRCNVTLLRGRLALAEGHVLKKAAAEAKDVPQAAKAKFHAAIDLFRKALSQDMGDKHVARQAAYLIGLCLMESGDLPAALNQMERTGRIFPETPEALAALYQQGDIARRMGRHAEAVSAYRRLMSAYAEEDEFHNPWVTSAQLKTTLLDVCLEYVKATKFQTAVLLSKSLVHVMPKVEALQLTAQIYHRLGRKPPGAGRTPAARTGQGTVQASPHSVPPGRGQLHGSSPRAVYDPPVSGPAVERRRAYFAGHDFRKAAVMLRLYMHNESRLRNAQALVDLGEAELSLGHAEIALSRSASVSNSTPATWPSIVPGCWRAGPR